MAFDTKTTGTTGNALPRAIAAGAGCEHAEQEHVQLSEHALALACVVMHFLLHSLFVSMHKSQRML